jgi:hypothetical protein
LPLLHSTWITRVISHNSPTRDTPANTF